MDKDRGFAGNVLGGKPRGWKQWLAMVGIRAAPVVAGGLLGGQEGLTGAMQGTAEALTGERERETAHRSKLQDIMMEDEKRRGSLQELILGRRGTEAHRRKLEAGQKASLAELVKFHQGQGRDTKEVNGRIQQWNPDTQRYDIDVGAVTPKAANLSDFEESFQREEGRLPTRKDRIAYEKEINEVRRRPERAPQLTPAQRATIGRAKSAALRDRNQKLDALRKEYAERKSPVGRVAKGEMSQADYQAEEAAIEQELQDRLELIDPEGAVAGPAKSDIGGAEMRAVPSHAPRTAPQRKWNPQTGRYE